MKGCKTLRIKLIIAILFLLCGLSAKANDGAYYVSGNQLVPLQETDISIHKEILTIYLQDNGFARVDVYYEFWNPGTTAKKLLMGFEAGAPYNEDGEFKLGEGHPNIMNFTVEMNGKMLNFQNAPCIPETVQKVQLDPSKRYYINGENGMLYEESNMDDVNEYLYENVNFIEFAYVYYFDAEFQPGLNKVHHTYSYRMSELVELPWLLDYKLTPASRWAGGKIGDFSLVVRADNTAKHFVIPQSIFPDADFVVTEGFGKIRVVKNSMDFDGDSPTCYEVSLRNGAVMLHKKDFRPVKELSVLGVGVYGTSADNTIRFGMSYDRGSSVHLWGWQSLLDEETMDKAFLLRLAHNMPFAHRGHVFKDKNLKEYFESLWWYMPDPNYKDDTSDFTDVDYEYLRAKFEE